MSYEAGVLFLPKFVLVKFVVFKFVRGNDNDLIWLWLKNNKAEHVFPLGDDPKNGVPPFPMPYDLPLQPYTPDDTPFVMDYLLDTMK